MSFFKLAHWELIDNDRADAALVEWGHWLGGCSRPFGRNSFGLFLAGQLVSVAVSASTVNARCAGFGRREVIELARLCSHPAHRAMTRVVLRLWRETAAAEWRHWPAIGLVSYQDAARHSGELYRFDGWLKIAKVRGGTAGGNWTRGKTYKPKIVWGWPLTAAARGRMEEMARKEKVSA